MLTRVNIVQKTLDKADLTTLQELSNLIRSTLR